MRKWLALMLIVVLAFVGCQAKEATAQPVEENAVENEIVVDASEVVAEAETEEVAVEEPPTDIGLGEIAEQLPAFKQGIFYNASDSEVDYVMTMEVAKYKNFTFEVGYSPTITALGAITYPIVKLKDLGINAPVLDLVEFNVGVAAGTKRIQFVDPEGGNEFVWGATATLINIKW